MLIEADGRITGLLSGGCLEQDLREHASAMLASGGARTVTYDMRADNDLIFGIGAGCEGRIDILLERAERDSRAGRAIARAAELSTVGEPTVLLTVHEGPTDLRGTHLWHAQERGTLPGDLPAAACARIVENGFPQNFRWTDAETMYSAWLQAVLPLPAILICGAGPDALPVAAALRALHFPVTVTDHRPAYTSAFSVPGVSVISGSAATLTDRVDLSRFFAAVVMSHHLASDTDYLRALAVSNIGYLGVLGPRARRARLLADLGGVGTAIAQRLRGPIGLDIGAVTPEGIALSIAADVHAVAAGHSARLFKQRVADADPRAAPAASRERALS